jgi:hypothetical protein
MNSLHLVHCWVYSPNHPLELRQSSVHQCSSHAKRLPNPSLVPETSIWASDPVPLLSGPQPNGAPPCHGAAPSIRLRREAGRFEKRGKTVGRRRKTFPRKPNCGERLRMRRYCLSPFYDGRDLWFTRKVIAFSFVSYFLSLHIK